MRVYNVHRCKHRDRQTDGQTDRESGGGRGRRQDRAQQLELTKTIAADQRSWRHTLHHKTLFHARAAPPSRHSNVIRTDFVTARPPQRPADQSAICWHNNMIFAGGHREFSRMRRGQNLFTFLAHVAPSSFTPSFHPHVNK